MIKKLMSNDFNKNVLKLMTGATIAQAIPVAFSPILTRIYTPEDFGVLALFISITTIFGTIANGRYELAIVLPKEEKDAINLVALAILLAFSISVFLLIIILLFHNKIIILLDNDEISIWLYFVPLVVFFIGLFNALNYLNTRMKTFDVIAKVKVVKSVSLVTIQMGLGILKVTVNGLLVGQIFSHVFANGRLAREVLKNKDMLKEVKFSEMVRLGKSYSNFPKYSMGAALASTLSNHLVSVFISIIYSTKTLGFYSLIQRIVGMPTNLLGQAFGQVFLQKASEEKMIYGHSSKTFKSTFIKLLVISIPVFFILFFIVEEMVAFIFGEEWRIAGTYGKVMMPLIMVKFIIAPISTINSIFDKQKISLIWQIGLLLLTLSIFLVAYIYHISVIKMLLFMTITHSFYYIILLVIIYKISRGK